VKLTLVNAAAQVRANATVHTASDGEVILPRNSAFGSGIEPGAYVVKAQAVAHGKTLTAANVILFGVPPRDDEVRVILLNADGTTIRDDLASQLQATGSEGPADTEFAGVIGFHVKTGAGLHLKLGSSQWTLSKPSAERDVPLLIS
jgi:hypothetical protein